jgi:hypothetical protein
LLLEHGLSVSTIRLDFCHESRDDEEVAQYWIFIA